MNMTKKILITALTCAALGMATGPAFAQDEPDWGYYAGRTCDATSSWAEYDHQDGTLAYWQVQEHKTRGQCVRRHVEYFKLHGEDSIPFFAR
jgi:hypothetical protein